MQTKLKKIVTLLIILFSILPISVNAENRVVSSTELIENASELDGDNVSYSGEVIGDILYRGDYAWIAVSDGKNAISVYIPASEAKKLEYLGKFLVVGDMISLTGTFHRACSQHGGDMDIHAKTINITEKGHSIEDKPTTNLLLSTGVLFLCAVTGTIIVLKKRL